MVAIISARLSVASITRYLDGRSKTMEVNSRLIRILVAQSGDSVLDVAVSIEASEKSVYKWMNGASMPDAAHFSRLLRLAGWIDDQKVSRL